MILYADGSGKKVICTIIDGQNNSLLIEDVNVLDNGDYLGFTHNEIEYIAVRRAIGRIYGDDFNIIYSDSQLVVMQLNNKYKIREPRLKYQFDMINKLLMIKKINVNFYWIKRDKNLAGIALDKYFHNNSKSNSQYKSNNSILNSYRIRISNAYIKYQEELELARKERDENIGKNI